MTRRARRSRAGGRSAPRRCPCRHHVAGMLDRRHVMRTCCTPWPASRAAAARSDRRGSARWSRRISTTRRRPGSEPAGVRTSASRRAGAGESSGLDEGAPDVPVLDEPSLKGMRSQSAYPMAAEGGAVGHGHHHVRASGGGASFASSSPSRLRTWCTDLGVPLACRREKVDELEGAAGVARHVHEGDAARRPRRPGG